MKLANLFLITALAGTLAVIGCTTDSGNGNGNGNGGTGGDGEGGSGGADIGCDEGDCLTDTALQQQCEQLVTACIARAINEEECIAAGLLVLCGVDDGTGGNGGGGGNGGNGGGGGTGGDPDPDQVCNEGLCADAGEPKDACKLLVTACIERDLNVGECVAGVLLLVCEVE